MIPIKTQEEIKVMREGGKILSSVMSEVVKSVKVGISTLELDQIAFNLIKKNGGEPAFLNYRPEKKSQPYPASLCVSANCKIVHGVPNKNEIIKEGDVVSVDLGVKYKGMITDMAYTVAVGDVDEKTKRLIETTKKALKKGIEKCVVGGHVGDIGNAVENTAKSGGFGVFRELVGHGVGKELHEEPMIPNFGERGSRQEIKEGMVFAIEPMLGTGSEKIVMDSDGFTYKTSDDSISAHFEHTVLITKDGPEILTELK